MDDTGLVLLLCCFLLGMANSAAHQAVATSGHPLVVAMRRRSPWLIGGWVGHAADIALLAAAMYFAAAGHVAAAMLYIVYSIANAGATWVIVRRLP